MKACTQKLKHLQSLCGLILVVKDLVQIPTFSISVGLNPWCHFLHLVDNLLWEIP